MNKDIHYQLLAPFEDADIEWRLQGVNDEKTGGYAVPYVTNRAIQYRLDDVVGFDKWRNEYLPWHGDGKKEGQLCGISIYNESRNEWITKYDGAVDSASEAVKGGLSDSMKRAAVQWGIGRYLYSMDAVWVKAEVKGKSTVIVKTEKSKLDKEHQDTIRAVFGGKSKAPPPVSQVVEEPKPQPNPQPQAAQAQEQRPSEVLQEVPKPAATTKTADTPIWVVRVAEVPTVSGAPNTNLQLKDVSGKIVDVLVKGTDPALVVGAALLGTQFSKVEKEGVLFHILDKYEVMKQAA